MKLKVLGCGDAFGSGGRLNTCFMLGRDGGSNLLIDCGATALVSMRRFDIDPNSIDAILISHLHGDHFGGLPIYILDAQVISARVKPLVIVGPPSLGGRLRDAMESMFPGSSKVQRKFDVEVIELIPGHETTPLAGVKVTGHEVQHPSGAPALALRIEVDDRIFCYSGDTGWVDALIDAARSADLFIAEAYTFDREIPNHLNWWTLKRKLPLVGARRTILTHMSRDMLDRLPVDGAEAAEDGMEVTF
ncbi:ribonuclease BN (tRNA processing enzyme) [Bradyrhizobium sp. USDA 4369]